MGGRGYERKGRGGEEGVGRRAEQGFSDATAVLVRRTKGLMMTMMVM